MIMGSWQIYVLGVRSPTTAFGALPLVCNSLLCYPPTTLASVCPLVVTFLSF